MQRGAVSGRGARALLALLGTAATVTTATAASAAPPRTADDLHDARYCEILVLEGGIPDAQVTVWNTIGLNRCPEQWWDVLDAAALADELGAGLVVLNGPRHFLMDEASGRTGEVRSFAGERLRRARQHLGPRTPLGERGRGRGERRLPRQASWHARL